MHEQRVRQVVQSPLGISLRISLRIQITLRCSLVMGNQVIGQLTSGLTWRWLFLGCVCCLFFILNPLIDLFAMNDDLRRGINSQLDLSARKRSARSR